MISNSLSLSLLAAFLPIALASNVMILDSANFTTFVGQGTPALVEFYAPWCGHCKNLAPIYEQLGDAFSHAKDKVIIAKVDADGPGREIGQKNGVTGFPTLKWYEGNSAAEGTKYEAGRELEDFARFIKEKTGASAKVKPPPPSEVVWVDTDTFDSIAMDKNKDVFVAFTAPWCGHCKSLKPIYEKVAGWYKHEKDIVLAAIDADAPQNKHLYMRYGLKHYPTIMYFPKGSSSKEPIEYTDYPWEANMVTFINEKTGSFRDVNGLLNDKAGKVATLDTFAQALFAAVPNARAAIYKDAKKAAEKAGSAGAYYLRVMQKIVDGSEEYVEKESKRLMSILQKRQAPPSKLDEVKTKLNVLASFVKEKAEEAVQAVKDEL